MDRLTQMRSSQPYGRADVEHVISVVGVMKELAVVLAVEAPFRPKPASDRLTQSKSVQP